MTSKLEKSGKLNFDELDAVNGAGSAHSAIESQQETNKTVQDATQQGLDLLWS